MDAQELPTASRPQQVEQQHPVSPAKAEKIVRSWQVSHVHSLLLVQFIRCVTCVFAVLPACSLSLTHSTTALVLHHMSTKYTQPCVFMACAATLHNILRRLPGLGAKTFPRGDACAQQCSVAFMHASLHITQQATHSAATSLSTDLLNVKRLALASQLHMCTSVVVVGAECKDSSPGAPAGDGRPA